MQPPFLKNSVVWFYVTGGTNENCFTEGIVGTLSFDGGQFNAIADCRGVEGLYVDDNRDRAARRFMRYRLCDQCRGVVCNGDEKPAVLHCRPCDRDVTEPLTPDWFWFCDTDISFMTWDVLYQLLAAADPVERPIMSALYFGYMGNGALVPVWYGLKNGVIEQLTTFHSGLNRLGVVGMGCCIIHRSVFEKFGDRWANTGWLFFGRDKAPWTPLPTIDNDLTVFGEDNCFCYRATTLGIPIYGNADIVVQHRKKSYEDMQTFLASFQQNQIVQDSGNAKLTLLRKAEDSGARSNAHQKAFGTSSDSQHGAAGNPVGSGEPAHQGNLSAGTPGVVEPNHAGQQPQPQARPDLGLGEPAAALFGRLRG